MEYGYCRISNPKQNIERQIRNIRAAYPAALIVQEAYTGTTMNRPAWQRVYKMVKDGDTIIFDSVSRLSRDAEEGFEIYQELYQRGVQLIFLKEPTINTSSYRTALQASIPMTGSSVDLILEGVNKFLMELAREQIRIAFDQAEKEVEDLHQRTREGIETARLAGKQIGLKRGAKLTTKKEVAGKEVIRKYCVDFGGPLNDRDTIKMAGISRNTYYKYKREIKESMA